MKNKEAVGRILEPCEIPFGLYVCIGEGNDPLYVYQIRKTEIIHESTWTYLKRVFPAEVRYSFATWWRDNQRFKVLSKEDVLRIKSDGFPNSP